MKSTLHSLLVSLALALPAAAAPALRIETTIATRGERIVSRPTVVVESGKQATLSSGDEQSELTCALTPTLLADGTVDVQAVITQRHGKKTDKLASPRLHLQLGQVAKVQVGELTFTAKASLVQ